MKNIAVVGGGAGGLILASKIAKKMRSELDAGKIAITIFDGAENHEFQPGYLGVAFRGQRVGRMLRPLKTLIYPGVTLIPENCSIVDIENRYVVTEKSMNRYEFDTIVVATGCVADPSQIPGMSQANYDFHTSASKSAELYEALSKFKSGKIVVGVGGLPYKCPPSPNEAAFMLDEFFTKRKIRDKVDITFLTPYLRAYSAEPISQVITPMYEDRNINLLTGFNIDSVDPEKKEVISLEGDALDYDMLVLVPPHRTVDAISSSEFVDGDGWVITDKRDMHIKDYDDAFSIGDNTNIPISKAGVEAHLQGIVVANNIVEDYVGGTDRYLFTGRMQCSMETGYHQATFVIGTYERPVEKKPPSIINYLEKKFMERIYWASLKGGYEWLFASHFGNDYYDVLTQKRPPRNTSKPEVK